MKMRIRDRLAPFTDFPIVFTSALTKQRILKVLELAKEVTSTYDKNPDCSSERGTSAAD